MQWLQEYYFLHVGKFCDESKQICFWSIVCSDCKNTIFCMLEHCVIVRSKQIFYLSIVCSDCKNTIFCMLGHFVMHQNKFSFQVLYEVIARILFSTWWNIVWCIKTNFLFKYCMQWLLKYFFLHVGTFSDESKRI